MLDYPGKNACVVFTPGCNFRCPFCHNPESVLPERIQKDKHTFIPDSAFFAFLDTRRGLLEGVSICGGEPTLQPDLYNFAQQIKAKGFLVKLDTNGRDVEIVARMIEDDLLDYVAVDMKHVPEHYAEACGVQINDTFWKNYEELLALLRQEKISYEYRTTVIKGLHTSTDIEQMGQYLAGIDARYLQTYKSGTTLAPTFDGKVFSSQDMTAFQKIGAQRVVHCAVRE